MFHQQLLLEEYIDKTSGSRFLRKPGIVHKNTRRPSRDLSTKKTVYSNEKSHKCPSVINSRLPSYSIFNTVFKTEFNQRKCRKYYTVYYIFLKNTLPDNFVKMERRNYLIIEQNIFISEDDYKVVLTCYGTCGLICGWNTEIMLYIFHLQTRNEFRI